MRTCFTVITRAIATIFAVFFVITSILAILLITIDRQMLKASLFKDALAEQQIYERLPAILGKTITSTVSFNPCAGNPLACEDISPELKTCFQQGVGDERYITIAGGNDQPTGAEQGQIQACVDLYGVPDQTVTLDIPGGQGGMPPFMRNLSASDWETLIKLSLPPQELQSMVEEMLNQLFAYLNSEINTVMIPIIQIRERLSGPKGTELIEQLLHAQPNCTDEELARINVGLGSGETIFCNPPDDETLSMMLPDFQEQLDSIIMEMPDDATLIKPPAPGSPIPGSGPFGADPIASIRTIRLIMRLSPLLPLAFLLLVTLFAVRSIKSWMRWWGIPIFVSGMLALGLGISTLTVFTSAWSMFVVPRIPPYLPADITGIGQELLGSIIRSISGGIILQAIILVGFGLAAWIGSTFLKTKNQPVVPVPPPAPVS